MLIGPTLGAGLVLLLLIAESGSGFLWRDAAAGGPRHYCPTCDLRYGRYDVTYGRERRCPRGHTTSREPGFSWTLGLVSACVTFIAIMVLVMATGIGG